MKKIVFCVFVYLMVCMPVSGASLTDPQPRSESVPYSEDAENSDSVLKGWQTAENGKKRYYRDGAYVTGLVKIGKKTYLFGKDGYLRVNAWETVNGKRYRGDKKGIIICSKTLTVGGRVYIMQSNGAAFTGWRKENGCQVYYNKKGARASGFQKIGAKTYYFNSKGAQKTGWRKIGSQYYFFHVANRQKGYMAVSCKINDITLQKNGHAVKKGDALEKLQLMVKANSILETLAAPDASSITKLHKCFDYVCKFPYRTLRTFSASKNWERPYVHDIFEKKCGNCFSKAYAFAYLANAAGYQVYAISSGHHGWAEIDGKIYDPDWTRASKVDTFFGMSYNLSGVNGRGQYKKTRIYVKKI